MSGTLALDLGTKCGWAFQQSGERIQHGWWNLKPGRFDGGGMRFVKFRNRLTEFDRPGVVVFEEVRRHAGTDAAHVYGGLMATLTAWCEDQKIPYSGVPVGVIKKHWTGKGNADKERMIAECAIRGFDVTDDNEADALALLHWQIEEGIYA